MSKTPSQREKTRRAYLAYLELLAAADWLRGRMGQQLESHGLTMMQYRVLETLECDGPQYPKAISDRFRCSEKKVRTAIQLLEKRGYVRREKSALQASPSWAMRAGPKASGYKIMMVRLTPEGERLMEYVFPKHAKQVKEEMRALEGREQLNLGRLCRKLRRGGPVRFAKDPTVVDPPERE